MFDSGRGVGVVDHQQPVQPAHQAVACPRESDDEQVRRAVSPEVNVDGVGQ